MIHTTDYQKAMRNYQRELADIARKAAIERDEAMQKLQWWRQGYADFWTRSQIPDSAFDISITWRDVWMALWG